MSEQGSPPVVVGVDGSADGLRAAAYAMREASVAQRDLRIVHAVDDAVLAGAWGVIYDPSVLEEAGRHAVDEARQSVIDAGFPEARVDAVVQLGNPASVLVRESQTAHMVVVGRRSVRGLERIFVGSTGVAVAANAECPVVMISFDTNPDPTGSHRRIGVGVLDTHDKAAKPLAWAVHEARVRDFALTVSHVIAPPPKGLFGDRSVSEDQRLALMEKARATVTSMVEEATGSDPLDVDIEIAWGNPIDHLVATSSTVDLMVLGTHGANFPGFALGGVVRGVMAHGQCPVGVIRSR